MALIDKDEAVDLVRRMQTYKLSADANFLLVDQAEVMTELMLLPPAQPEIITCGDCKHWICHDRRCGYWNHGVKTIDWCCHAERRTDGFD